MLGYAGQPAPARPVEDVERLGLEAAEGEARLLVGGAHPAGLPDIFSLFGSELLRFL